MGLFVHFAKVQGLGFSPAGARGFAWPVSGEWERESESGGVFTVLRRVVRYFIVVVLALVEVVQLPLVIVQRWRA